MRTVAAIALLAVLAGCGKEEPAAPAAPASAATAPKDNEPAPEVANAPLKDCAPATVEGFCGVKFGMTPDEAKGAFPKPISKYAGDAQQAADPQACFELFADEPIQGVSFLAEGGRVSRLDVTSEGPKTADGFAVGSAVADLRNKYGSAASETPNKYEPEVTDLAVAQGAGKFIFEIQDGKVRAWRAGSPPTIDYVEHCG